MHVNAETVLAKTYFFVRVCCDKIGLSKTAPGVACLNSESKECFKNSFVEFW